MGIESFVKHDAEVGASLYLDAAVAAIRRYCGWHVSPQAEVSGVVSSMGQRIFRLPLENVSDLAIELADASGAAYVPAETPADYVASENLVEFRRYIAPSVAAFRYTAVAGYDPSDVPDVVSVAVQAARRAAQAPAGAVKSQSVNGASVSYGFSGDGAPSVTLLESEKAILAHYRVGGSA